MPESSKVMGVISADMKKVASKAPTKIAKSWKAMSITYSQYAALFAKFDSARDMTQMTKLGKEQLKNSLVIDAWTTKHCGFSLFD